MLPHTRLEWPASLLARADRDGNREGPACGGISVTERPGAMDEPTTSSTGRRGTRGDRACVVGPV
jgi:hypothetical protein